MSDEPQSPSQRRIDWAAIVPIAILALSVITMIVPAVFGIEFLGISGKEGVAELLASFAHSPFAPLAVIVVFTVLGLTGFPQFLLIGGAAAIFGAFWGFIYSVIGTLVGALAGFSIGRVSGGALLRRYGSRTIHRASEILGRRGIFASAIVRLVPAGPAIMVNMIAGASHMRLWQFVLGTFIGILPKTALIALVGGHFATFLRERDPIELAVAIGVLGASIGLGFWLRTRLLKHEPPAPASVAPAEAADEQLPSDK